MPRHEDERALLLRILEESYARKGWHGPTLRGALRGLTANQAFWRPVRGRHNIWDFVLHCAYWKYTVWRKLIGARRGSFPREGSNWFETPLPTEKAWRDDLGLLADTHRSLCEAVGDAPAGIVHNKARLIYGVAAHDAYHTGQIQILKKLYGL
jgi:hypothetical protein